MVAWHYCKEYTIMLSSNFVCAHHRTHKFLHIYLVLKIHPNTGQMSNTPAEGEKKKIWPSLKGSAFE